MNSSQPPSPDKHSQRSTESKPLTKINKFVRSNLVGTIVTTIVGSLLLTGTSTYNIWQIYNGFQSTISKQVNLEKNSGLSTSIGQVLAYAVKLGATSGDLQWEVLYNKKVADLDKIFKQLLADVPPEIRAEANENDKINQKLIAIETEIFKLIRQGKKVEAAQLAFGKEYTDLSAIYDTRTTQISDKIEQSIQKEIQQYQQLLLNDIIIAAATMPILLASWLLVLTAVRGYIRDRQLALVEIENSRSTLVDVNKVLAQESQLRQQQEQIVREERDVLQQDIGELLDVVCEIEAGDFTIQAQVNDRATGLVSDTLNRLVEALGGVMSQVSAGARDVALSSRQQDKLAADVARNTSAQTTSVDRVLTLTETVRASANSAAKQLADTDRSVASLQTAVTEGEIAIATLDREIDVLQQGSDRIVQQMKALGEFVGLADKFVYDQSDIATQTQVLALNASLVAARAAEQRDPKQFEAVAREFESIASQVSQLAQQTNEGLTNLEQRNNQIERVVSDVDGEVQRLGNLVNSFTQGVKQSREVFATVQAVTGEVVKAGEVVAETSQTIIRSAESTAQSIAAIATLSVQIDAQSQSARSISTEIGELSARLLNTIQVFKLPIATTESAFLTLATSTVALTDSTPEATDTTQHQYQLN
jgi:methyl-accepting chemotaxis protein PixJ